MRFVLVHGAAHGAWCWARLIPELTALGHACVAIDLPGHGERQDERATLDGYVEAVTSVSEPGDILVGHSMGGAVAVLAAGVLGDRLGRLVCVAAAIPDDGRTIYEILPPIKPAEGLVITDDEIVIESRLASDVMFYNDCSEHDRQWAFERLCPQAVEPLATVTSLELFRASRAPRSYILCLDDRAFIDNHDIVADYLSRLGLITATALWSSHSPFISRPRDFANLLDDIARSSAPH